MPAVLPSGAIDRADATVIFAQQVRRLHRRRQNKGSSQRAQDIEAALDRIREAMMPLRTEIGRFPHGPQTNAAEANRQAIRDASFALQRERRKLFKMKR